MPAVQIFRFKAFILFTCLVFISIMWILDYIIIGTQLTFTLVYLIPISLATWFAGRAAGYFLSGLCTAAWFTVYIARLKPLDSSAVMYLNLTTKFIIFLCFTLLLHRLKCGLMKEKELSRRDELTGLSNRRGFYEALELEINRAARFSRPLGLVYIDVDNFKTINDRFGHHAGDQLLRLLSQTLRRMIRSTDFIARLGGDEIAIIFPEIKDVSMRHVLRKLKKKCDGMFRTSRWPATLSIGAGVFKTVRFSSDEVIKKVDTLMYRVKSHGKNGIRYTAFD